MLLAQDFDGFPYYVGRVDGYPGIATHAALEYFQASHGLPLTGLADQRTLDALVEGYVGLASGIIDSSRIAVAGGAGNCLPIPFESESPKSFPDESPQHLRRVEALLHDKPLSPSLTGSELTKDRYEALCRRVGEVLMDEEPRETPVAVVGVDGLPLSGARVTVFETDDADGKVPVASGVARDDGLVSLALTEGVFLVESAHGLRAVLEVDFDRVGGQMLVMSQVEES